MAATAVVTAVLEGAMEKPILLLLSTWQAYHTTYMR